MIELAPHQRDAVTRILALLDRYGGAILADDVGLGKSFVAAAVAAAMQARRSIIEVIVPASLVAQWRDTLRDFEVDARTITHDALIGDRFVAATIDAYRVAGGPLTPTFAHRLQRYWELREFGGVHFAVTHADEAEFGGSEQTANGFLSRRLDD